MSTGVPPDLVQAARASRLTLPLLTAADVTRIANLLCGHEPAESAFSRAGRPADAPAPAAGATSRSDG